MYLHMGQFPIQLRFLENLRGTVVGDDSGGRSPSGGGFSGTSFARGGANYGGFGSGFTGPQLQNPIFQTGGYFGASPNPFGGTGGFASGGGGGGGGVPGLNAKPAVTFKTLGPGAGEPFTSGIATGSITGGANIAGPAALGGTIGGSAGLPFGLTAADLAKMGISGAMLAKALGGYGGGGSGAGDAFFGGLSLNDNPLAGLSSAFGLSNIAELLFGKGATDPARLERLLVDSDRRAEGDVDAISGEFARRGLTNSGLGLALESAARESGSSRAADIRANETALAEERKRSDVQNLLFPLFGIGNEQAAIKTGQFNTSRALDQASDRDKLAAAGTFFSGIADAFANR